MKKTILVFGLISGLISSALMIGAMGVEQRIGFDKGLIVGYTILVSSMLLVYFGIRSYRDNIGAGEITFGKAFAIGIGITVISSLFYVVTWEIAYFNFMHDFMDKYGAYMVEKAKSSGATAEALKKTTEQVEMYRRVYENPLTNGAMTFLEPFPVGLLVTLLSAAVLRRKPQAPGAVSPQPAS